MYKKFSKPSSDLSKESEDWIQKDDEILFRTTEDIKNLSYLAHREKCLLCGTTLEGTESFMHRSVEYICCINCNHIQSIQIPANEAEFDQIYPPLNKKDWEKRRDRIYLPKLEWIEESLKISMPELNLKDLGWLDLGSGGGYFLGALQSKEYKDIKGIEENSHLISRSNDFFQEELVFGLDKSEFYLNHSQTNIVTNWFVLEHLDNPWIILNNLKNKAKGTLFAFSVPVFGFGTLLEQVSEEYAARSLDGLVHRQIFTQQSIDFMLNKINYKKVSDWTFGQDSLDLKRLILKKINKRSFSEGMLLEDIQNKIGSIVDPIQEVLDRADFSDAKHILSIKD